MKQVNLTERERELIKRLQRKYQPHTKSLEDDYFLKCDPKTGIVYSGIEGLCGGVESWVVAGQIPLKAIPYRNRVKQLEEDKMPLKTSDKYLMNEKGHLELIADKVKDSLIEKRPLNISSTYIMNENGIHELMAMRGKK